MDTEALEQRLLERQLQSWHRLMYMGLGSAITIMFHVVNPLRDAILLLALLYTTLSGFYLLWGDPWRKLPFTETRSKVIFGHLFASWLVAFGIFSYSMLPPLGMALLGYTIFLLVMYWQIQKKLSVTDEMFP